MNQSVIAFAGISGVGKTTFLKKLAALVAFQHLTGGSLIAAAREIASKCRDTMRHADLDENQRLLLQGFFRARDPDVGLIILDGHVVVDNGEGLTEISADVFKALDVKSMVHLEANPSRIVQNRLLDSYRFRPQYDAEAIKRHQDYSRAHANHISEILGISFHAVTHDEVARLAKLFRKHLKVDQATGNGS